MSVEYCALSDLPTGSCAHCRGLADDDRDHRDLVGPGVFTARWEGSCVGCGFDVEVGQAARYVPGGIAHAGACATEVLTG